jgi:ABC-type bacteriocin/lantibiotic exporter with double-glycine peptidase domain
MDNIDKMVIDDMIKTVKEHLYQTSPIFGIFLILVGIIFDLTFLVLLGLIVEIIFGASSAVKKIQKEYDKRTEIYLELMKNADKLRKALLEENFYVHITKYYDGDVDYTIINKTTNEKKMFSVDSKYVNKFDDMVNLDYDKFLKPCDD